MINSGKMLHTALAALVLVLSTTILQPAQAQEVSNETLTQRFDLPYSVGGVTYTPQQDIDYDAAGFASKYGAKYHGKPTASGETFDKNMLTAAHKTLPLNTIVTVTNLRTGLSVNVRINDRGPFIANTLIDLSEAAANSINLTPKDVVRVSMTTLNDTLTDAPTRTPIPEPIGAEDSAEVLIYIKGKLHAA